MSANRELSGSLPSTVAGLTCPSCGGTLEVAAGLRVVVCSYCETSLLALAEVGLRQWAVRPRVGLGPARSKASGWLSRGWRRDRRLRREAIQGEALLAFLPFFRLQADAVGFALGTEERRRTVGSGKHRRTETYEVDVERTVSRSFDETYPALDVAEWGVQRIDLKGDKLEPFVPESLRKLGMVFPATGSEVEIRQAAHRQIERLADPSRGLERVRFRFLETLRERFSVIYYPLWIIRYRFQERSYQILIDGEDCSLVYGKAPGNDLYRALVMVFSQAATLFVATTLVRFIGFNFGGLAFMGALIAAVLLWGWRTFRHGGVVVEGSGVDSSSAESVANLSESSLSMQQMLTDLMQGRPPRPNLWT